ncbi:MAG: hypothetical protein HOP30_11110 [Cyclobacteriaceae bacterium]|nr:hypothetical protein [Cyclobacteriaceae bacterium]
MGARGSLSLFRDVFTDTEKTTAEQSKGRSKELVDKRNECLIHRYWYYGNFPVKLDNKVEGKLSYPSILNILQEEFFINSEHTIPQIIDECYDQLTELRAHKPGKDYFRKKYPHLVW